MSVTLIAKIKAKEGSEAKLQEAFQDMIKKGARGGAGMRCPYTAQI